MLRSLEQWSAESLPESRLAFEELRRDLERARDSAEVPSASQEKTPSIPGRLKLTIHMAIPIVNCHVRAAQKFWLIYTMGDVFAHSSTILHESSVQQGDLSLRLAAQSMAFHPVAEAQPPGEASSSPIADIPLPSILVALSSDGSAVDTTAIFDRIALTVTADILDKLLAVVNRFEQDIDEILAFFVERKRVKTSETPRQDAKSARVVPPWTGHLILRGVNIGLRGILSTQYIGADTVEGRIEHSNRDGLSSTVWDVTAANLALSLAHDSVDRGRGHIGADTSGNFERAYRLAYFVLDMKLGNRQSEVVEMRELIKQELTQSSEVSHLHVTVSKVHAVMQAAAIEALDDLLEHCECIGAFRANRPTVNTWTDTFTVVNELSQRKKARGAEIRAIREKVISTFDINDKPAAPKVLPWIERCMMSIRLRDIGIAIPLQDIEISAPLLPHKQTQGTQIPPAFLLSTPEILFATCKGQAGYMKILDISAQFVKRFDQNRPHDFTGSHHNTRNRLLLPSSKLTITHDTKSTVNANAFTVNASMSGAQLDLDGTIVDSVFALVDLYEISLRRLARHAPDPVVQSKLNLKEDLGLREGQANLAAPSFIEAITFEASFIVESGVVRVHGRPPLSSSQKSTAQVHGDTDPSTSAALPRQPRRQARIYDMSLEGSHTSLPFHSPFEESSSTGHAQVQPDLFSIPKLTLWAIKKDAVSAGVPNDLHVNAIVHQSTNNLKPSLLPFLSDVSDALKIRMQKSNKADIDDAAASGEPQTLTHASTGANSDFEGISKFPEQLCNLQITFSLRIDESKLHFGCGNKIPVSALVDWKSGGILMRMQPGVKRLQATLHVESLVIDIKHS